MTDKYIRSEQAYSYLKSILYETAINNAGVKVEDFASVCEEIANNRLKIWMDDIPAADVVEFIRCKDCMWYGIYELKKDGTDDRRYKPSFCTLYDRLQDPDWFCGDGVPKEKTDANNGN